MSIRIVSIVRAIGAIWPALAQAPINIGVTADIELIVENDKFPYLSVRDNLQRLDRADMRDMQRVFDRFPILRERRNKPRGMLSGGAQQCLRLAVP